MKLNKRNRLFSPLRTACAAALLLCQPAMARLWVDSDPGVGSGVHFAEQTCMADAYLAVGGKGLSTQPGSALNCTAKDIEIARVVPIQPAGQPPLSCDENSTFTFHADVTIKSNAATRWDTTFYLPRIAGTLPQTVQGASLKNCSMLLPRPKEDGAALGLVNGANQGDDGDQCGDIRKSDSVDGSYTLFNQSITMACTDTDHNGQADFKYCASWDNQAVNNCKVSLDATHPVIGGAPNTKSKCNCDMFNIPIVVRPNAPTVTKALTPVSDTGTRDEPEGIFKYLVTVTKDTSNAASVNVTELADVVQYLDDDGSTVHTFTFNPLSTTNMTQGNLTLLANHADNTCDTIVLPRTLTTASPTLSCVLVMKVADENLPNDGSPELYKDFVRATIMRTDNTTPVGDNTCDKFDSDPANQSGNCSGIVTVNMANVNPVVEITKTPVSGPGLHQVGSAWFIDTAGEVTFELLITNNNPVDAFLDLTSLVDTVDGIDRNLFNSTDALDGLPACSTADDAPLAKGASFTCRYKADVQIGQGETYTNSVKVVGKDNEERTDDDTATASVTLGTPAIVLDKKVAAVVTTAADVQDGDFTDEAHVYEPGGRVVYQFTVTNNSPTQEALTISDFDDDVLFGNPRAVKSPAADQRSDECNFVGHVVLYGAANAYVCTLVADVSGNATNVDDTDYDDTFLLNTAQVKAKRDANGSEFPSNEDSATVIFDDKEPTMDAAFALKATVFLKVKNTSVEPIYLTAIKVLGDFVEDGPIGLDPDPDPDTRFAIVNDGGVFAGTTVSGCEEPTYTKVLDVGDEPYICAFSIEFIDHATDDDDGFTKDDFLNFLSEIKAGNAVKVEFKDEEGNPVEAEASVTIDTN